MNIKLTNGHLFIDGKQVDIIIFDGDYQSITFPIDTNATITLDNTTVKAEGIGNTAVYQKNVFSGGSIVCGGDFHIGDK